MKTAILTLLMFALCLAVGAQTTVQDWQAKAVQKYPDLAVRGSELNKRFVEAYTKRQKSNPDFLNNPQWPLTLADELAAPSQPTQPPTPPAPPAGEASQTDFLAMQGIAKRIEEFMTVAKNVAETKAMVPGKPASDGGYQIIIIASKAIVAPSNDGIPASRDPKKAWILFAMGAAAAYTKDSPKPITSIAFADMDSLKDYTYYVLDMGIARDIQQKLKSDSIDADAAYLQIKGALKKNIAQRSP